MKKESIEKRLYIKLCAELASPLCVSNGDDENTDNDVLVDFDGKPFLPGTSIAGPIRTFFDKETGDKLFGHFAKTGEKFESFESHIIVFDSFFSDYTISVRDGIKLGFKRKFDKDGSIVEERKVTIDSSKYDYEIIETGAKTELKFEVLCRKNVDYKSALSQVFSAINLGEIRFGYKQNRGLGKLKINAVYAREFSKKGDKNWFDFDWKMSDENCVTNSWLNAEVNKTALISARLELIGGISIRKYFAKEQEPDFIHIHCAGKPIIPGSSWSGAFLHRAKLILTELGLEVSAAEKLLSGVFGFVNNKKSAASQIIFDESVIEGGNEVVMTRNRINRFDASTVDGALYTEKTHFGGNCTLEIRIKNIEENRWVEGLILLVLKDLQGGFLSVGGETSIGRGLFSLKSKEEEIFENLDEKLQALSDKIKSVREEFLYENC